MSSCARSDTSSRRRRALVTRLLCCFALPACVVTTHEGPGHPPSVAALGADEPHGSETGTAAGSDVPLANEPDTITARHLLVQYRGAARASASIERTKEEARARAQEALERARAGESFEALVAEYSDEPGATERGGSLGSFPRHAMVEEFAAAAFALQVGEISDVVESPFGFHVIVRDE